MVNNDGEHSNGWSEWGKYVLKELERLNKVISDLMTAYNQELKAIRYEIAEFKTESGKDISGLKVKSGVWGLIGGIIPVLITVVFFWMNNSATEHKYEESIRLVLEKLNNKVVVQETVNRRDYNTLVISEKPNVNREEGNKTK